MGTFQLRVENMTTGDEIDIDEATDVVGATPTGEHSAAVMILTPTEESDDED